jgi:hypothetical protein
MPGVRKLTGVHKTAANLQKLFTVAAVANRRYGNLIYCQKPMSSRQLLCSMATQNKFSKTNGGCFHKKVAPMRRTIIM